MKAFVIMRRREAPLLPQPTTAHPPLCRPQPPRLLPLPLTRRRLLRCCPPPPSIAHSASRAAAMPPPPPPQCPTAAAATRQLPSLLQAARLRGHRPRPCSSQRLSSLRSTALISTSSCRLMGSLARRDHRAAPPLCRCVLTLARCALCPAASLCAGRRGSWSVSCACCSGRAAALRSRSSPSARPSATTTGRSSTSTSPSLPTTTWRPASLRTRSCSATTAAASGG